MRADQVVIAVATPVGAALLYVLLAGEASVGEAVAGAPVVAITCLYGLALARSGAVELRLTARGVVSLLRGCAAVLPDLGRVGLGLLRGRAGETVPVPFRFGGPGRDDAGRRAAVIAGMSVAPNGFVVGREGDALIVHRLVPDGADGGDREWPL